MASRPGSEELETIKAAIRALLIVNRPPLTLRQCLQAFRTSEGQELPYKQHGFRDPLIFLQSLPDTVHLTKTSSETEFYISPTVTEDVRHVGNLVSRQKGSAALGGHQPSTVRSSTSFSWPPPATQTSARPHRSPRSKPLLEFEPIKSNLHLLLSPYVTNDINLLSWRTPTSFPPPPPSGAGLPPSCAQREPVLSALAEFGARDAGAAAAPAGFERQQMSLNGCHLHSGNVLSSETAPLIELGATTPSLGRAAEVPYNTLSAEHLLQNAAQMVQSLSDAVEALLTARKPIRPAIKLTAPTYRSYGDLISARYFLDSLAHYQHAMGLDDEEILTRIVPVALTETAARGHRLSAHRAANFGEFRAAFLREFLPADYERRMRRELELRTQAPEESLQEFVRAMDELFAIAEPHASDEERVERVIRQAHPTFSAYLRGVVSAISRNWLSKRSASKATSSPRAPTVRRLRRVSRSSRGARGTGRCRCPGGMKPQTPQRRAFRTGRTKYGGERTRSGPLHLRQPRRLGCAGPAESRQLRGLRTWYAKQQAHRPCPAQEPIQCCTVLPA
ncbi:hypothetical protein HPB48_002847 [Haemaphysalis longicornis]|uniref:HTH OST-type domain-containing protein n=1 Tax=Haemaphysalis longicornis TaxID=44386 RepID=A0A9J6FB94_HAELO|nr:hypothetical protein HPB48_002847 [Haemaphysalis longicornis]